MRLLTVLGKAVATVAAGAAVGAIGTVMHRANLPWGLIGTLALVLTAAVTARAWAGWPTWFGYATGLVAAVMVMSQSGPGGDVLVPAGTVVSWVWVLGAFGLVLVVGLLPTRWFSDRRLRGRHAHRPAGAAALPPVPAPWPDPASSELPVPPPSAPLPVPPASPPSLAVPPAVPQPATPSERRQPGEHPDDAPRPWPAWPPRPAEPRE